MAALDYGGGCQGLALRVPAEHLEDETRRLWQRERIGAAYIPSFITVHTELGEIEALTFVADHSAKIIRPELTHEDQVRYCATGQGFLGTSRAYVENLVSHFKEMGIHDDHLMRFWADVCAYPAES